MTDDLCPLCLHRWHGLKCERTNQTTNTPCACPTAYRGDQRP